MFFQKHLGIRCIPEVLAHRPGARDNLFLCDASGLRERIAQFGPMAYMTEQDQLRVITKLQDGDMSLVAESDAFINKLMDEQFLSRAWGQRTDVMGSLPDVPAFIAGQPMNMRRRVRLKKPVGPLSIFLETTGSSQVMEGSTPIKRGAALLALTRVLSEQRPISLWTCATYGSHNELNGLICRVETTPLDLARAAWMLVDLTSMAHACYEVMHRILGYSPGSWAYGTPDLERRYSGDIFSRFLEPGSDVLFVPAMFAGDPLCRDPYRWLRDMLTKYGGDTVTRDSEDDAAGDTLTGYTES